MVGVYFDLNDITTREKNVHNEFRGNSSKQRKKSRTNTIFKNVRSGDIKGRY